MAIRDKNNKNGIFAAVGAATGLGNAFRFPALCVKYGAAFIFAYALALALVCFPLLVAELKIGRIKLVGKRAKIWAAVLRVAAANSALIAAYYAVIAAKVGGASASFALFGAAETARAACLFPVAVAAVLTICFLILRRGQSALSVSGRLSVTLSLFAFSSLAVLGIIRGGAFSSFDFSALKSGAIWTDALGQALLALSLAGGVMPAFARAQNGGFRPVRAASAIIASNFFGCMLSALATLPFITSFPQAGAVECALTVFPQIVSAIVKSAGSARVLGTALYAVLTVVAVHSLCSLANPVITAARVKIKFAPLLFCLFSAVSAFVFSAKNMQILSACDITACSVNAVIIALAECLFFASTRHIRGVIGFFVRYICLVTCVVLTFFSISGARFGGYPPVAIICAAVCFFAVFARAVPLSRLTFFTKRFKIKCGKTAKKKL